jgi:hypothetical protein
MDSHRVLKNLVCGTYFTQFPEGWYTTTWYVSMFSGHHRFLFELDKVGIVYSTSLDFPSAPVECCVT